MHTNLAVTICVKSCETCKGSNNNNNNSCNYYEFVSFVGMSPDGVSLMQRYVDQSGDVQTAAIVAAHCGIDIDDTKDHRVVGWCTAYQDLLDTWRLWHQR